MRNAMSQQHAHESDRRRRSCVEWRRPTGRPRQRLACGLGEWLGRDGYLKRSARSMSDMVDLRAKLCDYNRKIN
jgi:hypothetical protein